MKPEIKHIPYLLDSTPPMIKRCRWKQNYQQTLHTNTRLIGTKLKISQTPAFNGINMVLNCTLISSSTFQTSKLQYYLQLLHLTKTRINGHEKLEIGNGKLRKNIPEAM